MNNNEILCALKNLASDYGFHCAEVPSYYDTRVNTDDRIIYYSTESIIYSVIGLSHELGHIIDHVNNYNTKEQVSAVFLAYELAEEDRVLELPGYKRRWVYQAEKHAWYNAENILKKLRFKDWASFAIYKDSALKSYERGLYLGVGNEDSESK